MDNYTDPQFNSSALITIDTQNDFTLDGAPAMIPGTLDVIPNMVRLLQAYRDNNQPIIHVVRLYPEDGSNVDACRRRQVEQGLSMVIPGSNGAELVAALKPDAGIGLEAQTLLSGQMQAIGANEFVMYKPRWGAFYQTPLETFLQNNAINTLVFCGCNYPNCPRSSIYQASERDYRIVLVTDAVSQLDPKDQQEMTNIGVRLMPCNEMISALS